MDKTCSNALLQFQCFFLSDTHTLLAKINYFEDLISKITNTVFGRGDLGKREIDDFSCLVYDRDREERKNYVGPTIFFFLYKAAKKVS